MLDWDKEARNNVLYRDLKAFLQYVEVHSPTLTATKNIRLQWLPAINDLFIRKQTMGEKLGNRVFHVRSEDHMPSLRALDMLSEAMELTVRIRGRIRIIQDHKSFFDALLPREQFILIWYAFVHVFDWTYIQHIENDARIAAILQARQDRVWPCLWHLGAQQKSGRVPLTLTMETLRKDLEIQWVTAYGDNAEYARWGIRRVLFDNGLVFLGIARWNKSADVAEIMPLGRDLIAREIAVVSGSPLGGF